MSAPRLSGTFLVTRKLADAGYSEVALHRGAGYHYFIYDDVAANVHECYSIYTMQFRSLTPAKWLEEGIEFAKRTRAEVADRIAA